MKGSQIIGILIAITIGVTGYCAYQNEQQQLETVWSSNEGKITIDPIETEKRGHVVQMTQQEMDDRKSEERIEIFSIGGVVFVLLCIAFGVVKENEDKKDPIKNLEILRDKNIISQAEYEEKIIQANDLDNKNRIKAEQEKLLSELDNLKEKGILTDEEYQEKSSKIKDTLTLSLKLKHSPIKLGKLYVQGQDLGKMKWDEAVKTCKEIGDGWRLPSKKELNTIYENKYSIGGFVSFEYWSADEYDDYNAWTQNIDNGKEEELSKTSKHFVRAVRDF